MSFVLVLVALAACGAASSGDAARGEQLFSGATPLAGGSLPACIECHPLAPGANSPIGPGLAGIATRAAATVPNQSAEDYLRESILRPDAYLAGGFQEGIMPRDYRSGLSDDEVDALVAYMLTLRASE